MRKCKIIKKECKKHGLMDHVQEINGYFRCKRCRNDHVIKRRQEVKLKLVTDFGGKCKICGYNRCKASLLFHHRDPSQKEFGISFKGRTSCFDTLYKEAKKCVLICANCHGEVHAGLITI